MSGQNSFRNQEHRQFEMQPFNTDTSGVPRKKPKLLDCNHVVNQVASVSYNPVPQKKPKLCQDPIYIDLSSDSEPA